MNETKDTASGLFGPITDDERTRWQRVAASELADLLELGHLCDLPPLSWSVPTRMALTGQVSTLYGDPRATFEAWFATFEKHGDAFVLQRRSERPSIDGKSRLSAVWRKGRVEIAVIAEWWDDDETEVGAR